MSVAIEGGATSSSVLYTSEDVDDSMKFFKMGPANLKLMSQLELERFLRGIKVSLEKDSVNNLGIGMPGIITEQDKLYVKKMVENIWPDLTSLWVGSDVDTAMACLSLKKGLKIIVIGGTGSNCFGTDGKHTIKIGGYGHTLGDRGSSYAISLKALRLALREYEYSISLADNQDNEKIPSNSILSAVITALHLKSVADLVTWSTLASKSDIAGLAPNIIELFRRGNSTAGKAVRESITELAEDCAFLLSKFSTNNKQRCVEIGLTGSLFTKNEEIVEIFKKVVLSHTGNNYEEIKFTILQSTVQGALKHLTNNNEYSDCVTTGYKQGQIETILQNSAMNETELAEKILPVYLGLPQTECRNPHSMNLDTMSTIDAIDLMISEESKIYGEILKAKPLLEKLIEKTSSALKNEGRLFYVGAGTSGRLGILDASECPPTFRTQPEMVQGIIAGGFSSVSKAKEGAEDSISDGIEAITQRFVCDKDVVVGIAASGRTPFVWGAMYQAKAVGAFTTFLTFNVKLDMKIKPDLILAMDLGPEILTGSTRLKSGSATKCILNMLSTLAMVRMGKCFENLMIDLNPANQKLKQRALRIVLLMTNNLKNVTEEVALPVLQNNKYDIKSTVLELRKSFSQY